MRRVLTTEGTLLGGRVRYRQPAGGFRSGLEPVLLAASIPALPGEHVLEAGTGAGAGLLCLSARVAGCAVTGLELDAAMANLAAANVAENGFVSARIVCGDILTAAFDAPFDHAMANPPYHPPDATPSTDPARALAKRGSESLLADWISRMADGLRRRGTLTIIVAARMAPVCIAAMADVHCGCSALFPLWPKAENPAKLVIVRGIKEGRSPFTVHAGLVLHQPEGNFTDQAASILRDGTALTI